MGNTVCCCKELGNDDMASVFAASSLDKNAGAGSFDASGAPEEEGGCVFGDCSLRVDCDKERLMGDWQTKYGSYSIQLDSCGRLRFVEPCPGDKKTLVGILRKDDDWHVANIMDK